MGVAGIVPSEPNGGEQSVRAVATVKSTGLFKTSNLWKLRMPPFSLAKKEG